MDIETLMQGLNTIPTISTTSLPSKVIYISENNSNTCEECLRYNGKVFDINATDLPQLPIHPNCRCKYVADDSRGRDVTSEVEHHLIVNNLQKLHDTSEELAYDLANQIVKARNENAKLREQKIFLFFNGRYFMSSDGKLLLDAVSGKATDEKSTIDTVTTYGFVAK